MTARPVSRRRALGLAGLGTYSTGDHAPGERVELSSIERQATRAAILMSRIAAEKR